MPKKKARSAEEIKVTKLENQNSPVRLTFEDNSLLQELCGRHDVHLQQIEERLSVQLVSRGNQIALFGEEPQVEKAKVVLEDLYAMLEGGLPVGDDQVDAALRVCDGLVEENAKRPGDLVGEGSAVNTPNKRITPRTTQQHVYINALRSSNLVFGVGPAGTGKTYIATAYAVSLLLSKQVKKIILTRPVVEAGENLGFLPGTLEEKIDPYLRPFFDALYEMIGFEKTKELVESQVIEIAPLAYMRGRTLNNAAMILDEAQNTTKMQMKMFLTRMGEGSHMIITGDPSQTDLKAGQISGLRDSLGVLEGLKDIEVVRFSDVDVVRHDLVARIVRAYEERDKQIDLKLED